MIETTIKIINLPTVEFPNCSGYYCIEGKKIYVPAFFSKTSRQGILKDFILKMQKQYNEIQFTAIISETLLYILTRAGFKHKKVFVDCYEEWTDTMTWVKKETKIKQNKPYNKILKAKEEKK